MARGGCRADAPCRRAPVKVQGEDLATPGCPSEDRVRRSAGDSESIVGACPQAWLAREETPGL